MCHQSVIKHPEKQFSTVFMEANKLYFLHAIPIWKGTAFLRVRKPAAQKLSFQFVANQVI